MFQLKITLESTENPVWRRVLVDPESTFADLHDLIQTAFEWEEMHLHLFQVTDKQNNNLLIQAIDEEALDSSLDALDEEEVLLSDIFHQPKDHARYIYDLGDNWEHQIELEEIIPKSQNFGLPVCIEAKGIAPEEDHVMEAMLGTEYKNLFQDFTDEEIVEMIN
ncbi:hypothetical protein JCM21714_4144 [Gracilibacillus boraciitolerans JCM 21714]|uniref:Plasmid pRiA4b Orf3-like domain-containing protein n=1 Tax=Gracilibacillus boraciitolerans JCM 21714 TaxID=1298598 RepID=W4VQ43_9BACI|nr:plasmid pRiA4b ORF-3 family protein [Gracilibacillus boraciitolerans]GAE94943.1 hypothetical protein JCM21714_4144 [Gracilibacillus boraciitolerans JCM 21714]